jgi:hypothetical protein
MASQLIATGKATIAGFPSTVSPAGFTGVASFYAKSGSVTTQRKSDVITDGEGNPQGCLSSGGLRVMSMQFTPIATASNGNALVAAAAEEPTPLARVTVASSKVTSLNHARWVIVPGTWKLDFVNDGLATYSVDIQCAADSTVDLSATVS